MKKSDQALLDAFESRTLSPTAFSHEDHIRVAFAALARYEFFDACLRVADGLRDLAGRANVPAKFNATVTMAFLSQIAERMDARDYTESGAFLLDNGDLMTGQAMRMFTPERIGTETARRVALLPDLGLPGPGQAGERPRA